MADTEDSRSLTVVTSFSPEGYYQYGKDFLSSFAEYWPEDIRLVLYLEGAIYDSIKGFYGASKVLLNKTEMPEWWEFYEGINRFALMRGETPKGYNIQYDARMARKAFIQKDAVARYGGKVFWIDADVVTHARVPDDFLDRMLPDDRLCCYLGRDGWCYTESGFIGFNSAHQYCSSFLRGYVNIFQKGYIFTQGQWHDCRAFDMARLAGKNPEWFVNLSANVPHGCMHPFVNCELGKYMDHRKGPRKSSRTGPEDLVVPREEPYWQLQNV